MRLLLPTPVKRGQGGGGGRGAVGSPHHTVLELHGGGFCSIRRTLSHRQVATRDIKLKGALSRAACVSETNKDAYGV